MSSCRATTDYSWPAYSGTFLLVFKCNTHKPAILDLAYHASKTKESDISGQHDGEVEKQQQEQNISFVCNEL